MSITVNSHNRRVKKTRKIIQECNIPRLTINITLKHIYAQLFTADGSQVLTQASTLDKEVIKQMHKNSPNILTAAVVGNFIALRALEIGIKKIGFDRAGRKYHGRVKALADAARENGLEF